jgi:hypothetical protein
MTNLIDITDFTDAALDALLAAKAGEDVDVDHLTVTERRQVAAAMGWDLTSAFVSAWVSGPYEPRTEGPDYEGAILARQEADESRWG